MRILFMGRYTKGIVSINMHYHLERALANLADCKWASRGHPNHKEEPLEDTVKRLYGDGSPDWVIISAFPQKDTRWEDYNILSPRERSYKVATTTCDIHSHILFGTPKGYVNALNKGNYDAILMYYKRLALSRIPKSYIDRLIKSRMGLATMKYPKLKKWIVNYIWPRGDREVTYTSIDPDYYIKNLKSEVFFTPPHVDSNVFKPSSNSKIYDVTMLGENHVGQYPIRHVVTEELPDLAKEKDWNILLGGSIPGRALDMQIVDLKSQGYIVGEKYVEAVGRSKIFVFDCSIYRYPLARFLEGMACGTLVLSDMPLAADRMRFVPSYNFVEIGLDDWKEKVSYYLKHTGEREEIAQRGYETFLKYHTVDIRAKELFKFLEANK